MEKAKRKAVSEPSLGLPGVVKVGPPQAKPPGRAAFIVCDLTVLYAEVSVRQSRETTPRPGKPFVLAC